MLVILASGGYNSATYSGYACEAFPGCHEGGAYSFGMSSIDFVETTFPQAPEEMQGKFLPVYGNEWVHMLHRLFAVIGGTLLMLMAWVWLIRQPLPSLRKPGWWVMILIPIEVIVGIANALLRVPIPISSFHTSIAATLVGVLSYALVLALHLPKQAGLEVPQEPSRRQDKSVEPIYENIPA